MSRPETERAAALLARADADLVAVRALEANEAVSDEIVGFHAQQVAEKLLKAVLTAHAIEYPRTHSIRFLVLAPGISTSRAESSVRLAEPLFYW